MSGFSAEQKWSQRGGSYFCFLFQLIKERRRKKGASLKCVFILKLWVLKRKEKKKKNKTDGQTKGCIAIAHSLDALYNTRFGMKAKGAEQTVQEEEGGSAILYMIAFFPNNNFKWWMPVNYRSKRIMRLSLHFTLRCLRVWERERGKKKGEGKESSISSVCEGTVRLVKLRPKTL